MWPRLWRLISRSEAADADARPKTPDIQEEGIIVLRDDGPDAIVE